MTALEGGIAAVATASGTAALFMSIANIVCAFSLEVGRLPLIARLTRPVPVITSFRGQDSFKPSYCFTGIDVFLSTALYGGVRRSLLSIPHVN